MKLILGSGSPRRKEILSYFRLPFEQISSSFDESSVPFTETPENYVAALAKAKGDALAIHLPHALLLTADTIVFFNGKVYGKPLTAALACQALSELSGNWHTVYTALHLQHKGQAHHAVEATQVLFNKLTSRQIDHYIEHIPWQDKAGGYAIQMQGGLMVNRIEGCYYNVMGLPINSLAKLLHIFNIELWDYL